MALRLPAVYQATLSITITPIFLENLDRLLQITYISFVFIDRALPPRDSNNNQKEP